MWVARDKDNTLSLWSTLPRRIGNVWWSENTPRMTYIDANMFPYLRWEDEPLKVELISEKALIELYKIIDNYKNVDSKR